MTQQIVTSRLPLTSACAPPALTPMTVEAIQPAGGSGGSPRTWRFSVAVIDESNAPELTVRPPAQIDPNDPLTGHEVWYPLTDAVVVAGLRETGAATRLLRLLPMGGLNRVLLRMATPGTLPAGAEETLGTVCGLSTLACWPVRQRRELVGMVANAAGAALDQLPIEGRTSGARIALQLTRELALAYPTDALVLAPLLLQLRMIRPGTAYVIPPGWAFTHLRGTAIRIVVADTPVLGGGLGARDIDCSAFTAALTAGQASAPAEPSTEALDEAVALATKIATDYPG